MKYPDSFKEKCKKVYPAWVKLHELVEQGSPIVGRYLDDAQSHGVMPSDIFKCTNLDEVFILAQRAEETRAIFREWFTLNVKQQ